MSGELTTTVPTQLTDVGKTLLPLAAQNWASLTGYTANVGAVGPAGDKAAELVKVAYGVFAETADRLQDMAEAVCKIYYGLQLTDQLNADQMPANPGIVPQNALNTRPDLG